MTRTTNPACRSLEHVVSRRSLVHGIGALGGAAGMAGITGHGLGLCGGLAASAAIAETVRAGGKRVLVIFLHGGVSQLESWDPKPGTDTGGPFRAIPTSVPGVHVSELLPHTARQMHRLSIIRSLDTRNGDHGRGQREMTSGRDQPAPLDYPISAPWSPGRRPRPASRSPATSSSAVAAEEPARPPTSARGMRASSWRTGSRLPTPHAPTRSPPRQTAAGRSCDPG